MSDLERKVLTWFQLSRNIFETNSSFLRTKEETPKCLYNSATNHSRKVLLLAIFRKKILKYKSRTSSFHFFWGTMAILPNFHSWRDTSSGCVCKCISLQALGDACQLCVLAILTIQLVLGAAALPWSATDAFCSTFLSYLLYCRKPHGCPRWKVYIQQWPFSKDIWVFRLHPARTN